MAVKKQAEISLRYAQGEVFNCDKRFRVLVAGRRFGKSYLSCIELLRGASIDLGRLIFIVLLLIEWQRILRGRS